LGVLGTPGTAPFPWVVERDTGDVGVVIEPSSGCRERVTVASHLVEQAGDRSGTTTRWRFG
jgi:hypothetical protein